MAENLRGEDRDMGHMRVFDLGANKDFLGVVHAGRGFFCQHIDIGGKNVFLCNCQLKKCAALLRMCFFCCTFAANYKLGIVSNL